jgi:2-polyprenyl-3-methyl-5-hydroxy-6-metoxy-1,4-benzoquinol methylase
VARTLDPEGAHLAALRRLADFEGLRVLEVGCGEGRLTRGIATDAASVLAYDPDGASIAEAHASLPT